MKKLTFVFFALFLFSCCPEKKKEQTVPTENQEVKSNTTIKVDSSHFKTISKEKDSDIPEKEIEWLFEGEWGPV